MERTFVLLKPDAVKRKLMGEIVSRIERKNLTVIQIKLIRIDRKTAEEHYGHIRKLSIFDEMINFIVSDKCLAMILEGENAIGSMRSMMGKTSCFESLPGTIRGDYGCHSYQNLIHASDSVESAEEEIKRFFPEFRA